METYDAILNRMKQSYAGYGGFTPSEESDILIRLRVLAGEIYQLRVNEEYIARQLFPSTAEGEYLDLHAAERGLTRKAATNATGRVNFYPDNPVHPDILIPAGTVVCTYSDMLRFTTDSDMLLEENAASVTVDVTAQAPGAAWNVRAGTVSIIVTPVAGIGRVYNGAVFKNGTDTESDDALRARIIDSYVNIVNGANASYYRSLALSVPGVYSASVIGRARGSGTVNVYISGVGEPVPSAVKQQVQTLMNTGRELNVDVLVCDPEAVDVSIYIRISVEPGYVYSTVAEQVRSAVTDYINALGVGVDVRLSKIGEVVQHIKGVADYRFVDSYGSDRLISDSQYAAADSILVGERS